MTSPAQTALFSLVLLGFSAWLPAIADPVGAGAPAGLKAPAASALPAGIRVEGFDIPAASEVKAVWTQLGPQAVLEVRAVVGGRDCPKLALDLRRADMKLRADATGEFQTVCTAVIPPATKQAALIVRAKPVAQAQSPSASDNVAWLEQETGVKAPSPTASQMEWRAWAAAASQKVEYSILPVALSPGAPERILVLGDTGCRIKGKALQDCSNPETWPFPVIAKAAAKLRPDLVIHVGDYLYREQACPEGFKGCEGTPFGDNWPTWDADFFAPAAPLLAAAPWVMVRGNHEDCARAGLGFLRLLGPEGFDSAAACANHLAPYSIALPGLNLVVADNADAPETSTVEKLVPVYAGEIAALAKEPAPTWWLLHRPIWGLITGPLGIPAGGNLTLMSAVGAGGIPAPVELMLSGHIHTFEAINYQGDKRVPPQVVAGFGGDLLDPTPANLRGAVFQGDFGVHVRDGLSVGGFGFLLMTKAEDASWQIDVYDWKGRLERQCHFVPAANTVGRVNCPSPVTKKRRP